MNIQILEERSKSNLDRIFDSIRIIEEVAVNDFNPDDPSKFYVYHCAKERDLNSIFKFGFESFYLASNTGNMYGRGIYTTTDLESSIENARRGAYGKIIVKAQLISYDNYLIWDKDIAERVYGDKWNIVDQLNSIVPANVLEKAKNTPQGNTDLYSFITEYREYTSNNALAVYHNAGRSDGESIYDYIEGFVFKGSNDGNVAVIKNVKNLIPVYFSNNYGSTWEQGYNEKTLKHTLGDFDADYLYGKKYAKTSVPSNGYSKVTNKEGKINYIDKDGNEVSETWFNSGGDFTEHDGILLATVMYNNHVLLLGTDGAIYENPEDEYPICFSDELPEYQFD
jgi:hypothetical protein